jgi:uncharacterized OsmC-like protein
MRATLSSDGQLAMSRLSAGDAQEIAPAPDWGPVDHLAAAVAGCFAKSCHMVMSALGESLRPVEADVLATKADGKPSRVGRLTIHYTLEGCTADKAVRIAKDAKRICTVTNSLNCEIELVD